MKICFVLPRFSRRPIGGYKIVYEYANRLVRRGYEVCVFYMNENVFVEHKMPGFFVPWAANIMTQIEPRWFKLDERIQKISGNDKKSDALITAVDVTIATGVETVDFCEKCFRNKKKIYLIQDFENWTHEDEEVYSTYNRGFTNIVVSDWLKRIVDENSSEKSICIRNPIDLKLYKMVNPIEKRKLHSIGLLYHKGEHKGLKYSLEALAILKKHYPDLEVYMFGTSKPNGVVPGLVKFIQDASVQETIQVYNTVSVFMCSSIDEGYGLTGMEAMACGAVLATTDYEAVKEYALHGINSLLSPVRDVDAMVRNVEKLFEEPQYLYKLSKNGIVSLKDFDWEKAVDKLEAIICSSK